MATEKFNLSKLISESACFDLQFRKDSKTNRPNSPAYFRWKAQFIIAQSLDKTNEINKLIKIFRCGKIYLSKNQARFSVQNMEEIKNKIIPYFKKYRPEKNKEFTLWAKAVEIISKNKGKKLSIWKKSDFQDLIKIQKTLQGDSDSPKWLSAAEGLLRELK